MKARMMAASLALAAFTLSQAATAAAQQPEGVGWLADPGTRNILLGVAIIALALVVRLLVGQPGRGKPGDYGAAGAAICPRCGKPFARSVLSPNLIAGKLCRCPYCGKWCVRASASPDLLAEAEAKLHGEAGSTPAWPAKPDPEAEHLKRIDESRYE